MLAALFAKDPGASGTVAINAPLPADDAEDVPIEFVAVIFA